MEQVAQPVAIHHQSGRNSVSRNAVFLELSEIHLHDVFGMLPHTNDLTEALSGLNRALRRAWR
jgi:hypothetical protein